MAAMATILDVGSKHFRVFEEVTVSLSLTVFEEVSILAKIFDQRQYKLVLI